MKNWLRLALMAAITSGASGLVAATEQRGNDPSAAASCIEVEVNGERAPSFSCLTQKMAPTAGAPRPPAPAELASEAIAQRPSNQLGLFNRSATSQRMGNTFGTSVHPQRPQKSAPALPIIPRALP